MFGGLADLIAGIAPEQTPIGTHSAAISPSAATGLEFSVLIMLVSLVWAGVFLARARRTYPSDLVTAGASEQRAREHRAGWDNAGGAAPRRS